MEELKKIDDYRWLVPKTGGMRTEGIIYADEKMLSHIYEDKAHTQVANVAYLPGIVGRSLAMPDIHWGYGFPIGGVAAMDYNTGVISPGGIGYDINCGVRLLRTNLKKHDIQDKLPLLVNTLFKNIPSGVGSTGRLTLSREEMNRMLVEGVPWAIRKGYGSQEDLEHIEERGCLPYADYTKISNRAFERGKDQLGTLGAGNHFLEIQEVVEVYDEKVASKMGLFLGGITVMIHTGSRGFGYQVCDDYIRILQNAVQKYNISLPDRQLVCAPIDSPEGKDYFAAMCAAANYAWVNRQLITHWVRESFTTVLGKNLTQIGLEVVYDVAHNIGKIEEHKVVEKLPSGESRTVTKKVVVHRKGATRAFPAGHHDIPKDYRDIGQPVIIPGSMGTSSYVLVGTERAMEETWGSTCHGAGRLMSRSKAIKTVEGRELASRLEKQGILVRVDSWKTLAEETPEAYKNVDLVVNVCHNAGISRKIVKLKPLSVIKG
jgi:tRNA-splicing ligase RtcB